MSLTILLGYYDKQPLINTIEVSEWKWMSLDKIILEIKINQRTLQFGLRLFLKDFIIIYI